ncbi:chaplin family protein, partial [Streptomyces xanthophaeus]|uniref:chaplin family protein n=1 Tax=Streptomyces xanthophaeus TaxID=67385 RepID=UPI00365D4455
QSQHCQMGKLTKHSVVVSGNTVNVIGLLNPAFGNTCINASGGGEHHTEGYGH